MTSSQRKKRRRVWKTRNYIGRLAALSILTMRLIAWLIVLGVNGKSSESKWSWLGVPETLIAFWLGYHYDKHRLNSQRDELTGLYNRRYILSAFPKLAARAYRRGEKIGVFMIDVNDLKWINDTYGHQIGDIAICHAATLLLSDTRKSDIVTRWGGDEFLIITRSLKSDATVVSERIRQNMIAVKIRDDLYLKPYISIGSAVFPDDGFTLERLIGVADELMYEDKASKEPERRAIVQGISSELSDGLEGGLAEEL